MCDLKHWWLIEPLLVVMHFLKWQIDFVCTSWLVHHVILWRFMLYHVWEVQGLLIVCVQLFCHETSFLCVQSCLCLQQLSEALNCYLPWQMSNFTKIFLISAAMSVIGHSRNNKLLGRYLHAWFLLKPVLEVRRVPDQTVLRVEASSEQLCGTSFSM